MDNRPIGVFDSGVGGLTVVKELIKNLPDEKIIYLGDTARAPYGTKAEETIIRFSKENTKFLIKNNVKIIVVACNTSSAIALPFLQKETDIDILGVVKAGAKAAVFTTKNKTVGIIGTNATINSRAYEKEIKKLNSKIKIISKPTPLLVPLVEEGWLNRKETMDILKYYLKYFKKTGIDTLVLACTHYPLLKPLIKKILPHINLIDSAEEIAKETKKMLTEKNLICGKNQRKLSCFYVTDTPKIFNRIGRIFLKKDMIKAKQVRI